MRLSSARALRSLSPPWPGGVAAWSVVAAGSAAFCSGAPGLLRSEQADRAPAAIKADAAAASRDGRILFFMREILFLRAGQIAQTACDRGKGGPAGSRAPVAAGAGPTIG